MVYSVLIWYFVSFMEYELYLRNENIEKLQCFSYGHAQLKFFTIVYLTESINKDSFLLRSQINYKFDQWGFRQPFLHDIVLRIELGWGWHIIDLMLGHLIIPKINHDFLGIDLGTPHHKSLPLELSQVLTLMWLYFNLCNVSISVSNIYVTIL